MYYPPLFPSVRPLDAKRDPANPLDLSTNKASARPDAPPEDPLMMLDHRKLANLAASHPLSAMGRQLLDPALFRLGGYGAADAALLPGLAAPPFCYDRATGVAVPTSLAGHPLVSGYLQQQRERLEQQHQQALYAARSQQQAAAVAAAAAAYMDPAGLPLHLRNGLTQHEAAAALAATRGLYAPALPAPMVLPAFSLYTDDKGAFTSLRGSSRQAEGDKGFPSVPTTSALEAARYAEHFQRLRELQQQQQQHQSAGKCINACCSTASSLSGLGGSSVPCACCVQAPSQAALSARSPMGCSGKDPTSAATGKVCDFAQSSHLPFLHRPSASTTTTSSSSSAGSGEIRLSVSSLCTTQTTTEPATVSTSSSSGKSGSGFRPTAIWNAGLPSSSGSTTSSSITTSSGKTAFSVPKRKEGKEHHHQKEHHRSSGSIKDILKEDASERVSSRHDSRANKAGSPPAPKTESSNKHRTQEKSAVSFYHDEYAARYYPRESADVGPYAYHRAPPKVERSASGICFGSTHTTTTVTSATSATKSEAGSVSTSKPPPLLEAVRPADSRVLDAPPESSASPQGPPPLIAVSSASDHASAIRSSYPLPESSPLRLQPSLYPGSSLLVPPYSKHPTETPKTSSEAPVKSSSSSKSPKKSSSSHAGGFPKFNGFPGGEEQAPPAPLSLPKPIPTLPPAHLFPSHYRPAQHQLSLQSHNGWIPAAHPNVTVGHPLLKPAASTTASTATTSSSRQSPSKAAPASFSPAAVKREPDYADTANVLQSLLIRPAPGLEPLATLPPASATGGLAATSMVTPSSGLPIFGLDYRYPFPHQLLLGRDGVPPPMPLSCLPPVHLGGPAAPPKDVKGESAKAEASTSGSKSHHSSKKRSGSGSEEQAAKKRFQNQHARFPFQPASFASEAAEAPECPYTFIPEPPLNFSGQFKSDETLGTGRRDASPYVHEARWSEASGLPKSPSTIPAKSPPPFRPQSPSSSSQAVRARRRLRRRLLARMYQQRRPVAPLDQDALNRLLTVRYARKLLSQLVHRRYVHRWHALGRRHLTKVLRLKRQRKGGKVVYRIKKDGKRSRLQDAKNEAIAIPSEMKKLMVNKALGETPLHRAARLGYPEAVAYCLQTKFVSVNARDNAGYTPLHECCSRGHLDIARALLQYGADVNASAAGGIRPLHDAVENDHVEVVRLLLSYGADPTIATYSGLEPLKLARSPMMAEFLQGFFADISGEADSRPHLPWRFWGSAKCLDPEDCGYDVFDGVPSDPPSGGEEEGADDFLFEVSDSPHLPTFRLLPPAATSTAQCNYLRLKDVLRKLGATREDFLQQHPHIEVLALPSHEFEASALCSPLLTGTEPEQGAAGAPASARPFADSGSVTELVRLDNGIRQILGIETISVR